ncbi:MAG: UPF0146 family protein [Methanothrix sp.]|nr:UPF0146 family protein [Methanothrix sp.]MCX8207200.1 UPF0146 family protein [Methanothrix sp.]
MRGARDIAEFILSHYTGRIIEIGIGHQGDVARLIPNLIATDIRPVSIDGVATVCDDIFNPAEELYRGASLLYSIRPPLEMQIAMGDLALRIGADVLIRPMDDEIADLQGFSRELICRGEARFYLYRNRGSLPMACELAQKQ